MADWETIAKETQSLIAQKRLGEAQIKIQSGLEKFPDHYSLLINANNAYRASGKFEKSLEYAYTLIKQFPGDWIGYALATQDLISLKWFNKATETIQTGLERNPNQLNLLVIANSVFRASGNRDESLTHAKNLMLCQPGNWIGYALAAQDCNALNQFEEAKKIITSGLQKSPNQLNLLIIATDVFRASGNRKKSLKYSKALVSHHPNHWIGYARAAEDLIALKQPDEAQAKISIGLQKNPNHINLLTVGSDVFRASGDREKSLEYSEMLTIHHPSNWTGHARAAQDLIALKRIDEAQKHLTNAKHKAKDKMHGLLLISDLYRYIHDYSNSGVISNFFTEKFASEWTGYARLSSDLQAKGLTHQSKIFEKKALSLLNKKQNKIQNDTTQEDLNKPKTLYLLAGCSGCGKSTLLQHTAGDWEKLFNSYGSEIKIANPTTKDIANYKLIESLCLETTKKQESYLVEPQIIEARADKTLSKKIFMHIDIRDLLKFHANNILSSPEEAKSVSRGDLDILNEEVNNYLTKKFLSDPFFKRFTHIHVSTMFLGFKKNSKRFYDRSSEELFLLDKRRAKSAYKEVYRCWLRNVSILNPATNNIILSGKNYYKIRSFRLEKT